MRHLLLAATATLLLAGCAGPAPGAPADTPTVTTRGVGTVTGTPDTLTVVLAVATPRSRSTSRRAVARALLSSSAAAGAAGDAVRVQRIAFSLDDDSVPPLALPGLSYVNDPSRLCRVHRDGEHLFEPVGASTGRYRVEVSLRARHPVSGGPPHLTDVSIRRLPRDERR